MIAVLRPGPLATIQDLGRPGLGHLGVGRSGATDRRSLRLANRLVGNAEDAAAVELTFGGFAARFERSALVALAGAPCPAHVGSTAVGMYAVLTVPAGATLELGTPVAGLRTYVAVRGGIDVPAVLGSRATDTLAGLGPDRLRAGSRLPVGIGSAGDPVVELAPQRDYPEEFVLRILAGPREDWFVEDALATLTAAAYTVTSDCDRVGIRLDGQALRRAREGELKPEATVPGALQVPPGGRPILFLADHPVTGGYPVIAVVDEDDLHLAAQARPGQRLRFGLTRARGSRRLMIR